MRSIAQVVESGISTLAELQDALLTAIQLEFSTIPPYLCAEWSIQSGQDPSDVTDMVHGVVIQEMLHFGLSCNMLTAIGGQPNIASADFVPTYPMNGLPGGVQQGLIVPLGPLSTDSLNTFMQIEYPEGGPIAALAQEAVTIGAFYDTIAAGFSTVNPTFVSNPIQVVTQVDNDQLFAITSVTDAENAISEIKQQGEGTSTSPGEPSFDPNELAHYYTFAQIYNGAMLVQVNGQWVYQGTPIKLPGVYQFAPSTKQPDPSVDFNATFTKLLQTLQQCWTVNPKLIGGAIWTQMSALQTAGSALIKAGITPEFAWTSATTAAA